MKKLSGQFKIFMTKVNKSCSLETKPTVEVSRELVAVGGADGNQWDSSRLVRAAENRKQ